MYFFAEYDKLLTKFRPAAIRSKTQYKQMLSKLEKLMQIDDPSAAENLLIETLATLIEIYESRQFPAPQVSTRGMLEHLIEARGLKQSQVAGDTGISPVIISEVLHGHRELSKANIRKPPPIFECHRVCS